MDVVEQDRELESALSAWQSWMYAERDVSIGYPAHAVGIRFRPGLDFDDLVEAADSALAEAVDAIADDLPVRQRYALHARLLGSRWPFDRAELPQALSDAKRAVGEALRRRGVL